MSHRVWCFRVKDTAALADSCAQGAADFTLPISREQMARQLGMDRSALSRLLGRLRDAGLLRWDRSHFVLLDPAALRSLADDA